jgi:hypothetical protein
VSSFDIWASDSQDIKRADKPLWSINLEDPANEKKILEWLNSEFDFLRKESQDRIREVQKNIALYKGIQYLSQETRQSNRDREGDRSRLTQKIVVNHLYDLTQQKLSRIVKYKPDVVIIPTNDEFRDKVAAKVSKALWDHVSYINNLDQKVGEIVLMRYICGEAYLHIYWDFDKGPIHPDYKDAVKRGKQVPVLDDNGNPKKDESGKPIYIEDEVHSGEACMEAVLPLDVYPQRQRKWEDVEYVFRVRIKNTESLRQDYPDKASKIKNEKDTMWYNIEKFEEEKLQNETLVVEMWHKKTKQMPHGRKIVFTKDCLLENTICPYSHGEIPYIRLTDIETPGELHGRSFYSNIKGLQAQLNNLTSMIVRNQQLVAHPKWFVPTASNVKVEALGNDITIVRYHGTQPPILSQANPTPTEVFNFRDKLKEDMQLVSGVFGVSRGEPPPGIKAGVALQFLNEQENERANAEVAKYNDFIVKTARMTLSTCADYYEDTDKRTIMVLGRNSEWASMGIETKDLVRPFDIRIQNSTALPQSKAARVQYLMDLKEKFPTVISDEQFLDMLDFGQTEKFMDEATSAVRAAEAENDSLLNGSDVEPPEGYEMLIQHWKVHTKEIQTRSYKKNVPQEIKQKFQDHIMATEMLMVEAGKKNPQYMQALSTLPQFPMFFEPEAQIVAQPLLSPGPVSEPMMPPAPEGIPQAVANEALAQPMQPILEPAGEAAMMPPPMTEPTGAL